MVYRKISLAFSVSFTNSTLTRNDVVDNDTEEKIRGIKSLG